MNFLPIKNYEGFYEVSSCGTVRSIDRNVLDTNGVSYFKKGRVLCPSPNKNVKYLTISLWKNNIGETVYVHRLVATSHIPNPDSLPEVNHLDGNRMNNKVSNLEWCTSQGNKLHAITTGLRTYTNRLTREEFVECLFSIIEGESYKSLSDRVPYKVPFLSTKLRSLAIELAVEGELNESLYLQKVERARVNGAKNN